MRILQAGRHMPRGADEPLGRVRRDLHSGGEVTAGACLRLRVTTSRGASERKDSER
jgi:hypothetical protein